MEIEPAIPEPLRKSLIDAIYSGQYAAFVVWYDERAGLYRLHATAEFPREARTRYEKVRDMICSKLHEILKGLAPKQRIGLGGPVGLPANLPPGTVIGPEVKHTIKLPAFPAGQTTS